MPNFIQWLSLAVVVGGLGVSLARAADGAPVLLAAGDIAACDENGDRLTAALLDKLEGTVATLGDNAYEAGTAEEFAACYDPTWGRFKARTYPAPGNHDYETTDAAGYFGYFADAAGDPDKGYYSYDLGVWHIVALNSNCDAVGGCGEGSAQAAWLTADLAAHPARCTLAYWHHPRFSSGKHGSDAAYDGFWRILHGHDVDLVLNGHDHHYERFAPQDPDGAADPEGIRQFIVGTGGQRLRAIRGPVANSEVRNSGTFGVLKLTLRPESYVWEFVAAGGDFTDRGESGCH